MVVFQARLGKEVELKKALTTILAPTRQEAGCLFYNLHVAADNPARFLFHESWASKEHHAAHDQTPHIRNLLACIDELAFPPSIARWEMIGSNV